MMFRRIQAQTNTSATMSNEFIMFSAGLTDMIEAREENLREECGSQYIFSTAFHLPIKKHVISLSTEIRAIRMHSCRRDLATNIGHNPYLKLDCNLTEMLVDLRYYIRANRNDRNIGVK